MHKIKKVTIGNTTLYHGLSEQVMPTLQSESIDSFISDPPYEYLNHILDKRFNHEIIFTEVDRLLKNNRLVCFFGRGISFAKWQVFFDRIGYKFKESIIWDKGTISSPFHSLGRQKVK